MARVYVIIPSHNGVSAEDRADRIPAQWWDLTRPDSVKDPADGTRKRFSAIKHATEDQYAFVADDSVDISVHADADPSDLIQLCSELTDSEATALTNAINSAKGGTISSDTLLISNWTRLTQSSAEDGGWFNE